MRAINELGMGTNSKMHVGFKKRFWRDLGCNGETYADTGYQNTWEVSRGQAGTTGLLVDYTGGRIGASFGSGTPSSRAKQFVGQIEPLLPGATANWNGNATIDYWPGYEWTKGSYSYWRVGQYTAFAGMEGAEQNGCHFAGEHTSIDFQGYLQGGVETGQRAAGEIVAPTKASSPYLLTSRAAPMAPPRSPSVATLIAGGWSSTNRCGCIALAIRFA
jgi:monoamine oxidase